ncbi:hypothetical protein GGR57DRAFT_513428 [Xylariaceae sp. FL1272]|nr:hypothetical protein GGR57DRAFT_513428 [Xylariaceae sp. FL1272]
MADADAPYSCLICEKPADKKCGRCKSSAYCSARCQKLDFGIHKLLCQQFADFDDASRPTQDHIRAILFPVDQKAPKLVWLPLLFNEAANSLPFEKAHPADIAAFLGTGIQLRGQYLIDNKVLSRQLTDQVTVWVRGDFNHDGSQLNSSIASIPAFFKLAAGFRGPVIAFGLSGLDRRSTDFRDLNTDDFRHIADHLGNYRMVHMQGNYGLVSSVPFLEPGIDVSSTIRGVRVNCYADQLTFKKPEFDQVSLSQEDPIFDRISNSYMAQQVGLPVVIASCMPHPLWAGSLNDLETFPDRHPYDVKYATMLYLPLYKNPTPGLYIPPEDGPEETRGEPQLAGTTIVVRKDKKPLLVEHVEALLAFFLKCAEPRAETRLPGDSHLTPEQFLSDLNPAAFASFWTEWCNDKKDKGVVFDMPSPYDI